MFCKQCGTQLPDGSTFCTKCGTQLTDARSAPAAAAPAAAAPAAAGAAAAPRTIAGIPLRTVAKIGAILAMVAFLLPFITISCTYGGVSSKDSSATYSGFSLLIGREGSEAQKYVKEYGFSTSLNFFLVAAFACAAATCALLFSEIRTKIAALISAAGAVMLLFFRFFFRIHYNLNGSQVKEYIKVKGRFGLYLCILILLATAAACFFDDAAELKLPNGKTLLPASTTLPPFIQQGGQPVVPPPAAAAALPIPPAPPAPDPQKTADEIFSDVSDAAARAAETVPDAVTDAADAVADTAADAADAVADTAADAVDAAADAADSAIGDLTGNSDPQA